MVSIGVLHQLSTFGLVLWYNIQYGDTTASIYNSFGYLQAYAATSTCSPVSSYPIVKLRASSSDRKQLGFPSAGPCLERVTYRSRCILDRIKTTSLPLRLQSETRILITLHGTAYPCPTLAFLYIDAVRNHGPEPSDGPTANCGKHCVKQIFLLH